MVMRWKFFDNTKLFPYIESDDEVSQPFRCFVSCMEHLRFPLEKKDQNRSDSELNCNSRVISHLVNKLSF